MQLDQALAHIDGLLDLITPLLTEDSPEAMAQAMEQLQSSMTAFVQLAQRFEVSAFTPSAIAHMQRISDRLAQMRGHIVKIGAINQQQLQALMPQQGSAQQVADFGSNQATLYVKVYQLSANVGRGNPLTTSITR